MSWRLSTSSHTMFGQLKVVATHIICWNTWKEYNAITLGEEDFNIRRLEERIRTNICKWCVVSSGKKYAASIPSVIAAHVSPPILSSRRKIVRWMTPPTGRVKMNVDVVVGHRKSAAGAIVKDSHGRLLSAVSFLLSCLPPLQAELQAALYVTIFYSTKYHNFIIETNCSELIRMLENATSVMGVIRVDICRLRTFLQLTRSELYIRHETNSVAHHLASFGLTLTALSEYKLLHMLPTVARGCLITNLHTPYLQP